MARHIATSDRAAVTAAGRAARPFAASDRVTDSIENGLHQPVIASAHRTGAFSHVTLARLVVAPLTLLTCLLPSPPADKRKA